MFETNFDSYVCLDDSITCEVKGITYTARIEFSDFDRPTDADCYTPEQIADWKRSEWFYGGIVISACKNGHTIDDHLSSVWGLECNFGSNNDYLREVANDLLCEAIPEAQRQLEDMIKELAA